MAFRGQVVVADWTHSILKPKEYTMKIGRNDPCHCGSGRKYKHCHYEEDAAAELKAFKEAAEKAAQEAEKASSEEAESSGADRSEKRTGRSDSSQRTGRGPIPGGNAKAGGNSPRTAPRATRGAQRGG